MSSVFTLPGGPRTAAAPGQMPTGRAAPDPTGPDPTGPDPTGPDPTGPDPTGPDPTASGTSARPAATPDVAALDPAVDPVVVAGRIREHIVTMCAGPEGGHLGGSMSLVEILTALYCRVMRVDPGFPGSPERDVLLLSKGHGGIALYATLCEAGYFPAERLAEYARPGSPFMAHPHPEIPGVELPSGSLGHGLALGVGSALAMRLDGSRRRCFVIMGDGELQEGSVWEAAGVAAHHRLDNLTAVIDRNRLQITGGTDQIGGTEPLADRWRAFGWRVLETDGHDVGALETVLSAPPEEHRPTVVIAHTVKGKGVPAVEGQTRSHYARVGERQLRRLIAALRDTAGTAGAGRR